ncbi:hypothetical protein [Alkaliphilus crotonatoxidans]
MSVAFILIGLFAITCTIIRPGFYWQSRKARQLRRLLGDTGASLVYILIGIFLIGIALADLTGMINL